MPTEFSWYLTTWLQGKKHMKDSMSKIELVRDFYQSLGLKHDSNKTYYRGLAITDKGFDEFLINKSIKLKKLNAESWSCREKIATNFAESSSTGIVLRRKVPANKVIVNFSILQNAFHKVDWKDSPDYIQRLRDHMLEYSDECELVAESICTKCKLDEVQSILIPWSMLASWRPTTTKNYVLEFLRGLKNTKSSVDEFLNYMDRYDWKHSNIDKFILRKENNKWDLVKVGYSDYSYEIKD